MSRDSLDTYNDHRLSGTSAIASTVSDHKPEYTCTIHFEKLKLELRKKATIDVIWRILKPAGDRYR